VEKFGDPRKKNAVLRQLNDVDHRLPTLGEAAADTVGRIEKLFNGLQAAPILRRMFPKIPIFLFSFYADVVSEHLAAMGGINLIISKDEPLSNVVNKAHEMMGSSD
jgi:hypothetical protein